jgi:eukaryotic-like serine/threonine-protein kinase
VLLRDGQDLGMIASGGKVDLMEGTHLLELRGDQLKAPVQVEVTVKARDTSDTVVDLAGELQK